ncbi:hypothetical protein BV372_34660, partial [Nostoc sp. T09]|uniref:hypothetical protein n=1 Tax=Nostoc sp. T09 TaxID=1932621 RepID=UPI000B680B4C
MRTNTTLISVDFLGYESSNEKDTTSNKLLDGLQMKIFVAGPTGAIGRPLLAQLLAKGCSS